MQSIPLYILAGGRSSRFGADKARADIHGRPLILHLADALRPAATAVTVIADRADKFADLGLRTLVDLTPELGPLGGLQAALADAGSGAPDGYIAVVSCDWVGARAAWLELLHQAAIQNSGSHSPAAREPRDPAAPLAVAFRGEHWEPLFALYRRSIRPLVDQAILRSDRSLWRLLEAAQARAVPFPHDWSQMAQANTPAALAAWLAQHPRPTPPASR